jgi:hypothetical protein
MSERRTTRFDKQLEATSQELQQAARDVFLNSPQGQRVLDHILDTFCSVDAPTGALDPVTLAYRTGARDVGVRLKEMVYRDLSKKT